MPPNCRCVEHEDQEPRRPPSERAWPSTSLSDRTIDATAEILAAEADQLAFWRLAERGLGLEYDRARSRSDTHLTHAGAAGALRTLSVFFNDGDENIDATGHAAARRAPQRGWDHHDLVVVCLCGGARAHARARSLTSWPRATR